MKKAAEHDQSQQHKSVVCNIPGNLNHGKASDTQHIQQCSVEFHSYTNSGISLTTQTQVVSDKHCH